MYLKIYLVAIANDFILPLQQFQGVGATELISHQPVNILALRVRL
jgi:hypothetical protein